MLREWTGRQFASIGRSDVTRLLDKIEEKNGRRQANYCLAIFSSMANWFTAREDDYRSPVVKGMRRGTTTKRDRILNDDELRAIWKAAEANGTFGALIRVRTTQRESCFCQRLPSTSSRLSRDSSRTLMSSPVVSAVTSRVGLNPKINSMRRLKV